MRTSKQRKVVLIKGERWKSLVVNKASRKKYAVSNRGRIVSYSRHLEDGRVLATRHTQRYPSISFRGNRGINHNFYLHRLVAERFLKRKSHEHNFVIHLDHKKNNNRASNLKWVTLKEQIRHSRKDPNVIRHLNPLVGNKLDAKKVRLIKKMLKSKRKYTLRAIAKRFKVSDMQIHRIKSGKNWSHIK